jgi:DNA-binding IclR family transcriptional regulator
MNPPHTSTHDDLVRRISAEYFEMPGLRLTLRQASRLWGLDEPTCTAAFETLLEAKFLSRRSDGTYALATDLQSPARYAMKDASL